VYNVKILVVGKVPPPIGGVTNFTKRHAGELAKDHMVDLFSDFRFFSLAKLAILLIRNRYSLIYIHSFSWFILLFFSLISSKVIVIDHNHSSRNYQSSVFNWYLKCLLIRSFREVLVVSHHLLKFYPQKIRPKVRVISTFYPPTEDEIAKSVVPKSIVTSIEGKVFIVCSAWRLVFENGRDLYGFDQAIDLLSKLKDLRLNIKLVLCVGDNSYNFEYLSELKLQVERRGLGEDVVFWENCMNAWALFGHQNCLYFRPTLTDGNSVSIHEANYFGAKVLASDTVPRASFVNTYDYENIDDAVQKFKKIFHLFFK